MIVPVGFWCLRQALSQFSQWQEEGLENFVISVNISIKQLRHELVEQLASALEHYGVAPQYLELELTESIIHDADVSAGIIEQLKDLGVRLAIDDFGTGYSTLGSIRSYKPDTIKIDRCFLREMDTSPADLTIVRSVIEMAHSLGMVVVGEGIERPAQWELLDRLGCDHLQGFLLSPPIAADAFHLQFVRTTLPVRS